MLVGSGVGLHATEVARNQAAGRKRRNMLVVNAEDARHYSALLICLTYRLGRRGAGERGAELRAPERGRRPTDGAVSCNALGGSAWGETGYIGNEADGVQRGGSRRAGGARDALEGNVTVFGRLQRVDDLRSGCT